ncbi:Sodium-independent sulfate anion transporter [Blattella germanica]|nr:Sodium-independent sulfate anion transporter [Blattella germanica]
MCTKEFVKKRLPFTVWITQYSFSYFFNDMMAGLTVALTLIPQAIAYADVAGLEPQYGLYSAFMSSFTYIILGSCKDITIGPTAIMGIMTQGFVVQTGFLIEFISIPVTAGFISAAAITIASSQVKSLLGIGGSGNEFIESWKNIFNRIGETRAGDVTLGLCTIVLLLIGRILRIINKQTKITIDYLHFSKVQDGLPPFELPPFSTIAYNEQNKTMNFEDMVGRLGKSVDATQELFALGMCNVMSSFVGSMPITASFSRTAVNSATGVRTPLGGLMTGTIVLLALGLLTSTFAYIPKATLAGVIISAVLFMVEYEMVPLLWRSKKIDLIPLAFTFFASLGFGLDYGMLIGIGVNLMFILYNSARPKINIRNLTTESHDILLVTLDWGLAFPAAEYIRDTVFEHCLTTDKDVLVLIDGSSVNQIDSTVAKNLQLLVEDIETRKQKIVFWKWRPSAEIVCRGINKKMSKYFNYDDDLESLLQEITAEDEDNSKTEVTISTQNTSTTSVPNV